MFNLVVICGQGGFLSGKYRPGQNPQEGTRFILGGAADRYWHDAQFAAVETLKTVVESQGLNMVSVTIASVLLQSGITSALIGVSEPEQLDANLAAFDLTYDEELTAACEAA